MEKTRHRVGIVLLTLLNVERTFHFFVDGKSITYSIESL